MTVATYSKIFLGAMTIAGLFHLLWHGYVT